MYRHRCSPIRIGFIGDSPQANLMSEMCILLNIVRTRQLSIFTFDDKAAEEKRISGFTVQNEPIDLVNNCDIVFLCNDHEASDPYVIAAFKKSQKNIFYLQPVVSLLDHLRFRDLEERYFPSRKIFFLLHQIKDTTSFTPRLISTFCCYKKNYDGVNCFLEDDILLLLGIAHKVPEVMFDHLDMLIQQYKIINQFMID